MNLTLKQKLRAGHVRRWHIVAMAREQTIAEHMYRVQLITEAFLRALGLFDWNNNITLNAMEWARVHDLPEVVTGDTPSSSKRLYRDSMRAHGVELDAMLSVEKLADADIDELRECVTYDCILAGDIVKLADMCEAINWLRDVGIGEHAKTACEGLVHETWLHLDRMIGCHAQVAVEYRALKEIIRSLGVTP